MMEKEGSMRKTRIMKITKAFLLIGLFSAQTAFAQLAKEAPAQTPIDKWAQVLVRYSLDLRPGETLLIRSSTEAKELILAVYREALRVGAYPYLRCDLPERMEILFRYANDDQLASLNALESYEIGYVDAALLIRAPANTKELTGVDPKRYQIFNKSNGKLREIAFKRVEQNKLKRCITDYPTNALAQEAEMGLLEYRDFVFHACKLNESDPASVWKNESVQQREIARRLQGKDTVVLKGPNVDLTLSIRGRIFAVADGKVNFPDGEIFSSPVENSATGWIRFNYPAIYNGRQVDNVELWFKDGRVFKEKAAPGQEFLTEMLNTDEGARRLGELGIGTNYGIQRFSKNMLFDEKMGGTIHLALGQGFPECGGVNKSAIHWDMLCDMSQGEIFADGELFFKNGHFSK
jgi:aminopeptidase